MCTGTTRKFTNTPTRRIVENSHENRTWDDKM